MRFALLPALLACTLAVRLLAAQHGGEGVTPTPGDRAEIAVFRAAGLSSDFAVESEGTLTRLPFHAERVVALTRPDLERRVRRVLACLDANPQFVVQSLLRVWVGGEVTRPKLSHLPPETTVAQERSPVSRAWRA